MRWLGLFGLLITASLACGQTAAERRQQREDLRSVRKLIQNVVEVRDQVGKRYAVLGEVLSLANLITHLANPFFPRRAVTDGRFKLIHNLLASERHASESVDGDRASAIASQLPANDPVRQVMERLRNPPEWELYDLESDPIEFDNLADQPKHRAAKDRLQIALATWQEETSDPFRDPEFRQSVEEKYTTR